MKTNREIAAEAHAVTTLGRQLRDQWRQENTKTLTPRVVMRFPETLVEEQPRDSIRSLRRHRYVAAVVQNGRLLYQLMERDPETYPFAGPENNESTCMAMTSESSFEILRAGYELAEEERLADLLEPYAEWSENPEHAESIDKRTLSEVETILETNLLQYADRLRTRVEVAEFLEGRLEPNDFISRVVRRQVFRQVSSERMTQGHQMKLTIGEP